MDEVQKKPRQVKAPAHRLTEAEEAEVRAVGRSHRAPRMQEEKA